MQIVGPLIFAGLILMGVFTLANWNALNMPAELSFIVFDLEAPLGFVLLGSLLGFIALFTAYVLILRTTMLMDARHYARELERQQKLAENAEASRLTELRDRLERNVGQIQEAIAKSRTDLAVRIDELETALGQRHEETTAGLSAHLGEVEEKLDRTLMLPPAQG